MNPWDFVTWLSAVLLAGSAAVIFGFFARDARSILNREMHGHDDDDDDTGDTSASGATPGAAPTSAPEDLPR